MLTETLASGGPQSRWIPLCPNYYKYLLLHESRHVVVSHCTETCMNIIIEIMPLQQQKMRDKDLLHSVDMKMNPFIGGYLFKF